MAIKHGISSDDNVFRKQLRQKAHMEFLNHWYSHFIHFGTNDEVIRASQIKSVLINQAFLNKVFQHCTTDLKIKLSVTNLDFSFRALHIFYHITFNADTYEQIIIIIRLSKPRFYCGYRMPEYVQPHIRLYSIGKDY
jgi:hypothetical protein